MSVAPYRLVAILAGTLIAQTAQAASCTLDAPWDDFRQHMEQQARDPGLVSVASVDGGALLTAMNQWFDAKARNDAQRLEEMTIPLPGQYATVNRSWIKSDLLREPFGASRPYLAQVDPSNPYHVLVLSEIAMRIAGKCQVTAMTCDWVKLNGKWKTFPGGATIVP